MATKNKPNELYLTRVYDAPLKMVWDAFVDPKQAAKWWGPRGFTITTHSKDFKSGGHWDYTMHGPDGKDWPNLAKYHEVIPYKKLVYDHGGSRTTPPLFQVTLEFSETKGKTKMEFVMAFSDEAKAKETAKFIKQASGNSTWDRLGEYLAKEIENKEKFIINRSFDTDVETMYEMWTNPKHFAKWLAPTGFDMSFIEANIKPGGTSFYSMSGHGMTMFGKANYKEMQKPNRLVYVQSFADEKGNLGKHPGAPLWPAYMQTTVEFAAEENNKTRVTVTWEVVGDYTQEELQAFIKERTGMTGGWTGSFDKLEEYLKQGAR